VTIDIARHAEHEKYLRAYRNPRYAMGQDRMADAYTDLRALPTRGAYLDVACGRGEMLRHAARLGFDPVRGVEIVADLIDADRVIYGEAHALPFPDKSFDVVTLFDVIEHLPPGDDELACRELARVARAHVLLTANNHESHNLDGDVLHINIRSYDEWDALLRGWFSGTITRISGKRHYVSEAWRVDL